MREIRESTTTIRYNFETKKWEEAPLWFRVLCWINDIFYKEGQRR